MKELQTPEYVYNVLVTGTSIGLTFNRKEAERWMGATSRDTELRVVRYNVPDELFKRVMERPR